MEKKLIEHKLEVLGNHFQHFLNQTEEEYLSGLAGWKEEKREELVKYKNWDWFQGVGLFGFWKIYCHSKKDEYLHILEEYYDRQIQNGLPDKNINTVCPMLTLCCLYEQKPKEGYKKEIESWAAYVYDKMPRTKEGGLQHVTCEFENPGQLWADTIFMTVLFLAKAGKLLERREYTEEALYQIMIHGKYLVDNKTGLWYHGWNFDKQNNFAKALWARGNCWITLAVPEVVSILGDENHSVMKYIIQLYKNQVEALIKYQSDEGLWHTLIDEEDSYLEISGSAGLAGGILKGVKMGLLDASYAKAGRKGLEELMKNVKEDGTVEHVSIGTPMGESLTFYKEIPFGPMAYGLALCMLYLLEALVFYEK